MRRRRVRQLLVRTGLLAAGLTLLTGLWPQPAHAFNRNNLMDDFVFNQEHSMSAGQIDAFLNGKPRSCISPNSGFEARVPSGYSPSGGFTYGNFTTAGNVIASAAQVYDINPQVLIVTLEKEQSLVTGRNSTTYCNGSEHKYAAAMGYGCPDSGGQYSWGGISLYRRNGVERTSTGTTCVNNAAKAGFSQQVIRAAWLLKFGQQRSIGNTGWAIITGSWDNSDDLSSCYGGPMTQGNYRTCPNGPISFFDGYRTIDGVAVHMDTGATAALYWYTPHLNGNQNFVSIFTNYFGGTTGPPYAWSFVSLTVYADAARTQRISNPDHTVYVAPGQKVYAQLKARNAGRLDWNGSAVRVAVSGPRNRASPFRNSDWITRDRTGAMVDSSIRANEIATFNFSLTAPAGQDLFYEKFNLVYDGVSWITGADLFIPITVTNSVPPNSSGIRERLTQQSNTLLTGQYLLSTDRYSALTLLPDGNLVLYRDHRTVWNSGTGGTKANRLLLQADGNLVLYKADGQPVWATNTNGTCDSPYLVMQNDSNLALYDNTNSPCWGSGSQRWGDPALRAVSVMENGERLLREQILVTPNRKFKLIMQSDGNLVLYSSSGPVWATGTNGSGAYRAYMQPDGNLVLYTFDNRAVWGSYTHGTGTGTRLVVQNDRNLVLYNHNTPVWSSNTRQ